MIKKTRKQAARDGDKQFYNGNPCRKGHDSPRYVINGACVQCNAEAVAAGRRVIKEAMSGSAPHEP